MFNSKIMNIMCTPVNPKFTIHKWDLRGSTLHGHVSVMASIASFHATSGTWRKHLLLQSFQFAIFCYLSELSGMKYGC